MKNAHAHRNDDLWRGCLTGTLLVGREEVRTEGMMGRSVRSSWCKHDNERGEVGCSSQHGGDDIVIERGYNGSAGGYNGG